MATGDNVLTAVSVSKECKMVDFNTDVLCLDLVKKGCNQNTLMINLVKWQKVKDFAKFHIFVFLKNSLVILKR